MTKAKNSAVKRNKTADALQKVKIKKRTEWTGLPEIKIKEPLKISKELKNVFKSNILELNFKLEFSEWCDLNTRLSIPKTDTLPTALHSD